MNSFETFLLIVAILISYILGLITGIGSSINATKTQAIEYGYAQHNPKTGEWEWVKKGGE